jgi:hypothetical protein
MLTFNMGLILIRVRVRSWHGFEINHDAAGAGQAISRAPSTGNNLPALAAQWLHDAAFQSQSNKYWYKYVMLLPPIIELEQSFCVLVFLSFARCQETDIQQHWDKHFRISVDWQWPQSKLPRYHVLFTFTAHDQDYLTCWSLWAFDTWWEQ